MSDPTQLNDFFVDVYGRINKIEEQAMAAGLNSSISITEIHIIEKIGDMAPVRMGDVAKSLGVTLATLTIACDKLEKKELLLRTRDQNDRRVVNITLTDRGQVVYAYHKDFHERMISGILDTLSPDEVTILGESLEKLQNFFRTQEQSASHK